jgi:hypothetical protein
MKSSKNALMHCFAMLCFEPVRMDLTIRDLMIKKGDGFLSRKKWIQNFEGKGVEAKKHSAHKLKELFTSKQK